MGSGAYCYDGRCRRGVYLANVYGRRFLECHSGNYSAADAHSFRHAGFGSDRDGASPPEGKTNGGVIKNS